MNIDLVHLINAVRMNHISLVEKYLFKGADINGVDHATGLTPLHFAVLYRAVDVIPVLLAAGADVEAQDLLDETPLNLAYKDRDQSVMDLLAYAKFLRVFNKQERLKRRILHVGNINS